MSHDRGCHCGRERYEYDDCVDPNCSKADIRARWEAKEKNVSIISWCLCSNPMTMCDNLGVRCQNCQMPIKPLEPEATLLKPRRIDPTSTAPANSTQVGGNHYKTAYEHWDMIEDHGIGYLEGYATKYIARWRKKGGLPDLEKALHCTRKLIEKVETGGRKPRGIVPHGEIVRFSQANDLGTFEDYMVFLFCRWENLGMLKQAEERLARFVTEERNREATDAAQQGTRPRGYDPEEDAV